MELYELIVDCIEAICITTIVVTFFIKILD